MSKATLRMTAGIKWNFRKHFIQQQLPSCDSEWFRKWQEVWKLVLAAPSGCQDVCTRVRSGSFVFPLPRFPTAAAQLPHLNASRQMRQPLRILRGNKGDGRHSNRGRGERLLLLSGVPRQESPWRTLSHGGSSQLWGLQGLSQVLTQFASPIPCSCLGK